jgi:hypothetical protein
MKNWELCPKCNGEGTITFLGIGYLNCKCDVCNGQKIINSLTGKPPKATIPSNAKQCCGRCIDGLDECIHDRKQAERAIDNAIKSPA